MPIPMLNIVDMHEPIRDELAQKIVEVLDSARYIQGPYVTNFEKELAEFVGVKYAIGVSSGSDALLVALMALGVAPGDEIITTPFTFFATVGAIARLGAIPVFVDIDRTSFNIDVTQISQRITAKTKGIIPVSLFGQTADMNQIIDVAHAHGLWVLEDAAQSIGATLNSKMSGSFETAGIYSFFPAKNLGAIGDGGAVTTDSDDLAARIVALRTHGGTDRYFHDFVGGNFRLDALQAAVLSVKLPHLTQWQNQRRANAALYNERLAGHPDFTCPTEGPGKFHVFNQYVLRIHGNKRDAYQKKLKDAGVAGAIYYPLGLHEQRCFAYLGHKHGDFPETEAATAEVLALPVMTQQASEVLDALLG